MPIDPDFKSKRQVVGEENGVKIWGPINPPTVLGIRGDTVAVDWDLCNGDEICVDTCPVSVFEMVDTPGHPKSEKKSNPVRQQDCIFCMACEAQCPEQAIKVFPP